MLDDVAAKSGLRISCQKTKTMQVRKSKDNGRLEQNQLLTVGQTPIEDVNHFTYLGSVISCDGDSEQDVKCRIGKAAAVFQRMQKIWTTPTIPIKTKIQLYQAVVLPTIIYASETWKNTKRIAKN